MLSAATPAVSTADVAFQSQLGDDGPQILHEMVCRIYDVDTADLATFQWSSDRRHVFHQFGRCRYFDYCTGTGTVTVTRVKRGLRLVHGAKSVYSADSPLGRAAQNVMARMYPYLARPTPSEDPMVAAFKDLADVVFGMAPGLFSYPYHFTADRNFPGQIIIVHHEVSGLQRRVERKPKGWLAIHDLKSGEQYSLPRTDREVREILQMRRHRDGRVGSHWDIALADGFVRPPLQ
jgi:hypothetical protein